MFESMTYESILKRALSNVPSNVDKREGSIIYDALAPACAELAQIYIQLDIVLNNAFADTAEREFLELRAKERGIAPKEATRAILKMEATYNGDTENIKAGDRFALNDVTYTVIEQMTNDTMETKTVYTFGSQLEINPGEFVPGWWKVECDTEGIIGNKQFGDLIPIETIKDLKTAKLTELLVPGEDLEETEDFRQRYFEEINNEAFGGNRADYKKWVKEIDGVGMVKLVRAPESGGTVGLIITDSDNNTPTQELVKEVKEYLDPVENEGLGCGIAPIGHIVDVKGADGKQLSITVDWQLLSGANSDTVYGKAAKIIKEYLETLNEQWEDTTTLTVNAFQIMAKMSELNEIVDITSLTIDGERAVTLNNNEIFDFNYIVLNGGKY